MTAATVSRQTSLLGEPFQLPVDEIDNSPLNPRTQFDEAALEELAASMSTDGLLQPIVVRSVGDRYVIVAGERRWRAAKRLDWDTIAAIVRDDIDDAAHVRLALLENLARSDLKPLEEARGYQQLADLGMTQEQIAEAVHRSRPAVANSLRLLKAPEAVRQQLDRGTISPSHVLALLRYEAFPKVLVKIAEVAAEKRTPTKELEKGLGYEATTALTESKLAVSLYRAEFDRAVCETCPFGAHVKGGPYDSYCLKPEHFHQLQKEVRDKRKVETKAALEGAKDAAGGTPVLKLSSLRYGQYERLDWDVAAPKGCSKQCECRRAALDGTRTVAVCVKPARLRELRDAERKAEETARKERQKQLAEACGAALEKVEEVRSRELALVAAGALEQIQRDSKQLLAILAKHAPELKAKDLTLENLAKLQPLQLVKLATEALLAEDLRELQWGRAPGYATWYADPQPKASKASKPSRKGRPRPETAAAAEQLGGAVTPHDR